MVGWARKGVYGQRGMEVVAVFKGEAGAAKLSDSLFDPDWLVAIYNAHFMGTFATSYIPKGHDHQDSLKSGSNLLVDGRQDSFANDFDP